MAEYDGRIKVDMRALVVLMLLTGCASVAPSYQPSSEQVLAWAQLDVRLGRHSAELTYGQADGKAVLGDRVLVLNGEAMVCFVRAHGYARAENILEVRRLSTATEVDVIIVGKDGARMTLTLQSDGSPQGSG